MDNFRLEQHHQNRNNSMSDIIYVRSVQIYIFEMQITAFQIHSSKRMDTPRVFINLYFLTNIVTAKVFINFVSPSIKLQRRHKTEIFWNIQMF